MTHFVTVEWKFFALRWASSFFSQLAVITPVSLFFTLKKNIINAYLPILAIMVNTFVYSLLALLLAPLLASAESCYNAGDYSHMTNSGKVKNNFCNWIYKKREKRAPRYCLENLNIMLACPRSCAEFASSCPCDDIPGFTFNGIKTGKELDCAWLEKSPNMATDFHRKSTYCAPRGEVAVGCAKTCGFCS